MKRFIAILLIITLFMIVSCATEESINTPDETTVEKSEETTTSEYKSPEMNFNNAVINIGAADHSKDGYSIFWAVENYCDAYAAEQNGDPINDALYLRNQRVEEELGVTINIQPLGTFVTAGNNLQKIIMAADDIVDIAFMNGNFMSKYLGSDMIIDLNSIPNVDFSHSWWDQHSVKEFNLFGTMRIVTGDISINTNFAQVAYFFNKKIAENYKLENMYELVRKSEWTVPKMIEMSRSVAHDVNGDGIMDEADFYGLLAHSYETLYSTIAGGVRLTTKDREGVPQITVNTERTANIVEMLTPFLLDGNVTIIDNPKYAHVFNDLMMPTFLDNRALFFTNQILIGMELRNMDADFGVLPEPKFDSAQENHYTVLSSYWATYIIVPTTNNKFDITGHVLEAMGFYSQQYVTPAYIDTTVFNKTLRDDDSAEMMRIIMDNRYYDLAYLYDWGGIYNLFPRMVGEKKTAFASEFAKIETKMQTEIDKTVELLK
ncbi:MAG: hypothetical protein FWF15_05480 [Oscillospiraceae bacterium]|nr:hypothetical protein [Oscillospiraceae bacterium]